MFLSLATVLATSPQEVSKLKLVKKCEKETDCKPNSWSDHLLSVYFWQSTTCIHGKCVFPANWLIIGSVAMVGLFIIVMLTVFYRRR